MSGLHGMQLMDSVVSHCSFGPNKGDMMCSFYQAGGSLAGIPFRTAEPATNQFIVALHVFLPFQKIDLPMP